MHNNCTCLDCCNRRTLIGFMFVDISSALLSEWELGSRLDLIDRAMRRPENHIYQGDK